MGKLPKVLAIITILAGVIMIAVGTVTYLLVQRELADESIVVSDDAENFAGDEVTGPFTAYSQATVIKKHALEAGGGLTYAELDREDPARDTVMDASFLRASLFTSVVAFGIAALLVGLGFILIIIGFAIMSLDKHDRLAVATTAPPGTADPAPFTPGAPIAPPPADEPLIAPPVEEPPAPPVDDPPTDPPPTR